MRLTLRTMLAYIDNVLDPADAEVLGSKIQASDFARDLVHRIRTVLKKVRMDAPKLDSKRVEDDANTVSDYLDGALPQDRIGEFERACIDSDRHLAEVASCHQILTMVLGKPAEVPQALRDRMYGLGDASRGAHRPPPVPSGTAAPAAGAPPIIAGNGQAPVEIAPAEVPEYLRSGRRSGYWGVLAIAGALALIAVGGLWMAGFFKSDRPELAETGPQPSASTPVVPTPAPPPAEPPAPSEPTEKPPVPERATLPPLPDVPIEPPADMPPQSPAKTPAEPAPPVEAVAPLAPMPMPAEALTPTDVPEKVAPAPAPAVVAVPKAPLPAGDVVPEVKTEEIQVGLYVSDDQVLGRWSEEAGVWLRVKPREVLTAGERLIALPAYRPQLGLASGVQVTLAGESAVLLQPPGAGGASQVEIDHGKLLVVTVGAAGSQLEISAGDIHGVLTLADADSAVAVHVKKHLAPGSDPESTQRLTVLELFNTNGRLTWEETGKPSVEVPAHHVLAYVGAEPPEAYGPFANPDWVDAKDISDIDKQTAPILEDLLEPENPKVDEKPLNVALLERMQDRRVNVRALAARSLSYIDQFQPLVKELNDPKQSAFWAGEFIALRHAISRSAESAALLKATLELQRPDDAKDLYRLLWGYSPEQLSKDGASQLVKYLEHPAMDVRVLAFQNLYSITGAMEFYMPQKLPQNQKAAIQSWKGRLDKGTIVYKLPPSAIETYKPLAER